MLRDERNEPRGVVASTNPICLMLLKESGKLGSSLLCHNQHFYEASAEIPLYQAFR